MEQQNGNKDSQNGEKISPLKKWLSDNKIYFETIMTISLTIMGICISIISLSIDKRSVEIQEQQNMPSFGISQKYADECITEGGLYFPERYEIEIVNYGGNISNAYLEAYSLLEVELFDNHNMRRANIVIEDTEGYVVGKSHYSAERKSFTIMRTKEKHFQNLLLELYLKEELAADYKEYTFTILPVEYVNIKYLDFRGRSHDEWYKLYGSDLVVKGEKVSTDCRDIKFETLGNDYVYSVVQELLDDDLGLP